MNDKKTFLQGFGSGLFIKLGSAILSFLIIPIYIQYFGTNDYGSIIVLTTAITLTSILNLGLPNAIATIGAQSFTYQKVYYLFKTTFFRYIIYLFLCFLLLTFIFNQFNAFIFHSLLKSSFTLDHSFFLISLILATALTSYIFSLFIALHKLHLSNLMQGFATLQYPFALYFTIMLEENIQFYFSLASLFAWLNILIFLLIYLKIYAPKEKTESHSDVFHSNRNILVTSFTALSITIISLIINQIDVLIISYYLTKPEVVQFSILAKIIGLESLLYGVFFGTLAPIIGKWYRQNNFEKIKAMHLTAVNLMSVAGGIILLGNMLFMHKFISLWVGQEHYVGVLNTIIYSLFIYLFGMYSINFITYSSFNIKRKTTLIISIVEPSIKIILSILLTKFYGISGTIFSTFLLALFITFPITTLMLHNFSNQLILLNLSYPLKNFFLLILPLLTLSYYISNLSLGISIFLGVILLFLYILGSWLQMDLNQKNNILKFLRKDNE